MEVLRSIVSRVSKTTSVARLDCVNCERGQEKKSGRRGFFPNEDDLILVPCNSTLYPGKICCRGEVVTAEEGGESTRDVAGRIECIGEK